jgi:hypothetical protein
MKNHASPKKQHKHPNKRRAKYTHTPRLRTSRARLPSNLERFAIVIKNLSEPAQILLVIGLLLLVAWIVSNPEILQGIIRALQIWWSIKGFSRYLVKIAQALLTT